MQGTRKTAARTALIVVAIAAVAQTATSQTRDELATIVQINGRGPFVINPGAPK
jgi:hypothetical protein